MNRVFLLGAGFSHALSDAMPLMRELSADVIERVRMKGRPVPDSIALFGDDIERWLSYLGDAQPWFDDATILHNRGYFTDLSAAIAETVAERQLLAVRGAPPAWLDPLVEYWRRNRCTVITFNYDVLVELAATGPPMPGGGGPSWLDLYPAPLVPAAQRTGAVFSGGRVSAMRLLKLHGSVTWYWSGFDSPPSDPIYDVGVRGGWGVDGLVSPYAHALPTLVSDKASMVVPPAATKTRFYENAVLRTQWKLAAEALGKADELVMMGYSMPPSDTITRVLLCTEFNGDLAVPVNTDRAAFDNACDVFGVGKVTDAFRRDSDPIGHYVATCCS